MSEQYETSEGQSSAVLSFLFSIVTIIVLIIALVLDSKLPWFPFIGGIGAMVLGLIGYREAKGKYGPVKLTLIALVVGVFLFLSSGTLIGVQIYRNYIKPSIIAKEQYEERQKAAMAKDEETVSAEKQLNNAKSDEEQKLVEVANDTSTGDVVKVEEFKKATESEFDDMEKELNK